MNLMKNTLQKNTLHDKFNTIAASLNEAELENFKILLGLAAGGLATEGNVPNDHYKSEAFNTVLNCLAHIQPSGIVWRGRPEFMTDNLLSQFQNEAVQRYESAIRHDNHFFSCGGSLADQVASSKLLNELS